MPQDVPMRHLLAPALLTLALTGCGGGGSDSEAKSTPTSSATQTSSSSAPEPVESSTPEGESTDCRLSATKFADRAADHALNFATTAPAFGEREELSDLDDLNSEVSVLCSAEVVQAVAEVMVPLAEANYEISKCAFDPDPDMGGCKTSANNKVHGLGEDAAELVGELRNLLEA